MSDRDTTNRDTPSARDSGEGTGGTLSLFSLAPDGQHLVASSYFAEPPLTCALHLLGPEGTRIERRLATNGRLRWLDSSTAVLSPLSYRPAELRVERLGAPAPLHVAAVEGSYVVGVDLAGTEMIVADARTRAIRAVAPTGEERSLGTLPAGDFSFPEFAVAAHQVGGEPQVLMASITKLTPARAAGVYGAEADGPPRRTGIVLTDAVRGRSIVLHAIERARPIDVHVSYGPVELREEPSATHVAVLVRNELRRKVKWETDDLIVCDLAGLGRAFADAPRPREVNPRPSARNRC